MRKKGYKGVKCTKRNVKKCEGVCRTYDELQYKFADLLSESADAQSFQVNVLLDGLELGAYTSDFVATKTDGTLMVRECVYRDKLTKPLTCKMLDASRECQTAHCGRGKSHFIFGGLASPIVPYRHLPQTLCGLTADCRSLV